MGLKPKQRTGNIGKPLYLREAIVLGVKNGWTSKETAFETGWPLGTLQTYATRMQLSFAYAGMGSVPQFASKDLTKISTDVKLVYGHKFRSGQPKK